MKTVLSVILVCIIAVSSYAQNADETLGGVNDAVGGVAEVAGTVKADAVREFELLINLVPSLMNQPVDDSEAEDKITDAAYHIEFSMQFDSIKRDFTGLTKSTHAYFGLNLLKHINAVDDWADSTTSYAFVYGHRYYGLENHQGPGYGWFAGFSMWSTSDAYWWDNTLHKDETESGISPIAALEIFYKYQYKNFVVHPRILLTLDKDFGEFLFLPQLMMGVHF